MFFKYDNVNLQMKFISKFANTFYIEIENKPVKLLSIDSSGMITYKFDVFGSDDVI